MFKKLLVILSISIALSDVYASVMELNWQDLDINCIENTYLASKKSYELINISSDNENAIVNFNRFNPGTSGYVIVAQHEEVKVRLTSSDKDFVSIGSNNYPKYSTLTLTKGNAILGIKIILTPKNRKIAKINLDSTYFTNVDWSQETLSSIGKTDFSKADGACTLTPYVGKQLFIEKK